MPNEPGELEVRMGRRGFAIVQAQSGPRVEPEHSVNGGPVASPSAPCNARYEPHVSMSGREPLLNVSQVAARLGVSKGWVRDHASGRRRPSLPVVRLGKLLRFEAADIDRFIKEQLTEATKLAA